MRLPALAAAVAAPVAAAVAVVAVAVTGLMSAVVVSASPGPAGVLWEAEGLSELPAALARAKQSGRRLLIGLSGGPG